MYLITAHRQINRKNCNIRCTKYLELPVIPRTGELMTFSSNGMIGIEDVGDTSRVREVAYDILGDNSVKISIWLEDPFFSNGIEKIFGWDECYDLIYYDHVRVMSHDIEEYTLYKSGYDGEPHIVFNNEIIEKFKKNFC